MQFDLYEHDDNKINLSFTNNALLRNTKRITEILIKE